MKKIRTLALSFLSVLLAGLAPGQSTFDDLKKRFLSEYPEAFTAWKSRYAHSEGKCKYTEDDPANKAAPHRDGVISFKCMLPAMGKMTVIQNTAARPEDLAFAYNKDYSFSLRKADRNKGFSIESLHKIDRTKAPPKRSTIAGTLVPILLSPYAMVIPIERMVSSPRFVVQAISPVSRNGKSLLKIEFDWPNNPSRVAPKRARDPGGSEGYILVSPEERWVVYEYECRDKKGSPRLSWKGTVDYQGSVDGFPIPKRITRQRVKLPGGELVASHSFDFLEFRFADIPDREFTLAAFGLPEEASRPAKYSRTSSLGYWLLAIALIALAAAVYFKIASSRRSASAQA